MVEVSVCVISYNFEKYISQTLDSVLAQMTNFEYEIIVSDDCSSDKTQEILLEYKRKYPDLIKLVLLPENTKGAFTQIRALELVKGKYIAILEGDDFWCNENKLQMQYDYMESHPEKSAVVTHLNAVDEFGNPLKMPKDWDKNINKEEFSIKDYEKKPISPFLQSLLFRNKEKYIDLLHERNRLDNYTQAMLLCDGNIGILPDITATYRIVHFHGENYSSLPIEKKALLLFNCGLLIDEKFGDKINTNRMMDNILADAILFGHKSMTETEKEYYKKLSFGRKCDVVGRIFGVSIFRRGVKLIKSKLAK